MKYMKYYVMLVGIMLLCACGKNDEAPSDILPEEDNNINFDVAYGQENANNTPIQIVVEDDATAPHDNMARSPLTNEWVDADVADLRPIAVMIPNESAALPQYNLSEASIIYEANMEGRMTRMMALFENWESLEKIGNIRSARTYFIYWAYEWDAFLVHFGGPYYINYLTAQETTENIDGLAGDGDAFYRSKDRNAPHNVYADGKALMEQVRKNGYSPTYRGIAENPHFKFTSKAKPNTLEQYGTDAENAIYIDLSGCYPLTRCYFEFNEEDGLYYRFQHLSSASDGPHTDASGTQLAFKNILVQFTKQDTLDAKGYLAMQCHDNTRDGCFFTNGKCIHVNWTKEADYSATHYYDDAGKEIVLNTGKTMICIVNENDSFTFR